MLRLWQNVGHCPHSAASIIIIIVIVIITHLQKDMSIYVCFKKRFPRKRRVKCFHLTQLGSGFKDKSKLLKHLSMTWDFHISNLFNQCHKHHNFVHHCYHFLHRRNFHHHWLWNIGQWPHCGFGSLLLTANNCRQHDQINQLHFLHPAMPSITLICFALSLLCFPFPTLLLCLCISLLFPQITSPCCAWHYPDLLCLLFPFPNFITLSFTGLGRIAALVSQSCWFQIDLGNFKTAFLPLLFVQ